MSRTIGFSCGGTVEIKSSGGFVKDNGDEIFAVVDGRSDRGVFRVESFDDWLSVIPIGNRLRIMAKPFVGTNARNVSHDVEIPTDYDPDLDPSQTSLVDLAQREGTIILTHVADYRVTAELKVVQKAEIYGLVPSVTVVSLSDLMPAEPDDMTVDVVVQGGSKSFRVKSIKKKRETDEGNPVTMTFDDAVFTSQEKIIEGTDSDTWRLHIKSYGRIDMRNEWNKDNSVYYEITVCHVDRPREQAVIKVRVNSDAETLPPNPVTYSAAEMTFAAPEAKKTLRTKKKSADVLFTASEDEPPSIEVLGAKNGVLEFDSNAGIKTLLVNTVPNNVMITVRSISDYVFCDVDRHKITVRIDENFANSERRCMIVIGHAEKFNVKQSIIVKQEGKEPC